MLGDGSMDSATAETAKALERRAVVLEQAGDDIGRAKLLKEAADLGSTVASFEYALCLQYVISSSPQPRRLPLPLPSEQVAVVHTDRTHPNISTYRRVFFSFR